MHNQNWSQIADLYARLVELGPADREQLMTEADLSGEDRDTLNQLLLNAARETGFFSTGGASSGDLQLLENGSLIGNWRVIELIGAGGMGEVYRVERADGHFEQIAALKRIMVSDQAAFGRFERERQILAQLEHPNIARLIDGGVDDDGAPFLVMEFIEGTLLADDLRQRKLSLEERLRAFLRVCAALEHAHTRFVLHRDIKPSNMMVTAEGELKLIDFGVAGLVEEGEHEARVPYTLAYAAPEQVAGEAVSVQSDVYGLGVSLSEILGNQAADPNRAAGLPNFDALPADIRAIISKATAKTPNARYASVDAFANDIRNYLAHRPVVARNGSVAYQSRLFLRRNYLAVGLFSVLVAGMAGTFWQYRKAEIERDVALQQRERLVTMQAATFLMFTQAGQNADEQSAKGLIKQAAEQAQKDFEENPADAASVLHMFGELLFIINDYVAAEPLLKSVADLPVEAVNEDLVARASHDLANVYLRSGKAEEAKVALEKAMEIWRASPARYYDQIVSAALIRSQLKAEEGDMEAAAQILNEALPKRLALSGETSMETAILRTSIGVARMRQGDTPGAIEASEKARNAFRDLKRLETPDGLNATNNLATLYHVSGRLEEAEAAYASAMDIRESLYGPSAALAVLMSNYGKLKLQTGQAEQATNLLSRAVDMADEFSGPSSPPALAARFGLVESLLDEGNVERAASVLADVTQYAADGGIVSGPYAGMLYLATAQVRHGEGRDHTALSELQKASDIFTEIGPAGARYMAKVKQLRGDILRLEDLGSLASE